jgi:hypothetical protein
MFVAIVGLQAFPTTPVFVATGNTVVFQLAACNHMMSHDVSRYSLSS